MSRYRNRMKTLEAGSKLPKVRLPPSPHPTKLSAVDAANADVRTGVSARIPTIAGRPGPNSQRGTKVPERTLPPNTSISSILFIFHYRCLYAPSVQHELRASAHIQLPARALLPLVAAAMDCSSYS